MSDRRGQRIVRIPFDLLPDILTGMHTDEHGRKQAVRCDNWPKDAEVVGVQAGFNDNTVMLKLESAEWKREHAGNHIYPYDLMYSRHQVEFVSDLDKRYAEVAAHDKNLSREQVRAIFGLVPVEGEGPLRCVRCEAVFEDIGHDEPLTRLIEKLCKKCWANDSQKRQDAMERAVGVRDGASMFTEKEIAAMTEELDKQRTQPQTIYGMYNQRNQFGELIPWTVRSPRELVTLCLHAIGEKDFTIDVPEGISSVDVSLKGRDFQGVSKWKDFDLNFTNPAIEWNGATPELMLADLCEQFNCTHTIKDGKISVHGKDKGEGTWLHWGRRDCKDTVKYVANDTEHVADLSTMPSYCTVCGGEGGTHKIGCKR